MNGINEMIRNFSATARTSPPPGVTRSPFASSITCASASCAFQEETGHLYNLEATPAEGTTYRFAKEDSKRFPTSFRPGPEAMPYYTNSSQLPVGFTDDPFEALERQEPLQKQVHRRHRPASLHERAGLSRRSLQALVRRALERFRLPYITVTPTFSICPGMAISPASTASVRPATTTSRAQAREPAAA